MKTPQPNSDERWQELVRRAQADAPPPVDTAAVLRAVRVAAAEPRPGWLAEFAALFAVRRTVPACLFAAAAFALMTSWQAWDLWQALPWAQMVATTTGGAP